MPDYRFSPRCRWRLRLSGLLHRVCLWLFTGRSGQPVGQPRRPKALLHVLKEVKMKDLRGSNYCLCHAPTPKLLEELFNILAPELFFILAHPVYKKWIIQEPNTLELWNKLHFEEKKNGEYIKLKLKLNSVALVRTRTIPTERLPLVGEVSANFCG